VEKGHVRINGQIVVHKYRFKNNDAMLHRTHRHEPSIAGKVEFVGHTDTLLAVCKPPSIPVHPCGAYRFNSLMYIMAKEPMIKDQPVLYLVHRLDRVTSGLVVLAKSKESAQILSKEIRDKSTQKTYLARVKGKFPLNLKSFKLLTSEDCMLNELDDEDDENDGDEPKVKTSKQKEQEQIKQQQQQLGKKRDRQGGIKKVEINESDMPPRVRDTPTFDEVVLSERVGCTIDAITGNFILRCPIGVLSHRDGVRKMMIIMMIVGIMMITIYYSNQEE
jgi:16S rRNA U516 pseudouridylate synthase RsuA-like enzyme